MNCPRCGKPVPPGSTFCMHCGQMFAPQPQMQQPMAVPMPGPSKGKQMLIGAGVALTIIILGLIGLSAAGILQFNRQPVKNETLVAQAPSTTPILPRPKPPEVKMPDDIYNWLEHLRRIEQRRGEMSTEQVGRVQALMMQVYGAQLKSLMEDDAKTPPQVASGELAQLRQSWGTLLDDFRSYPPPAECRPIAGAYDGALSETKGMMADLLLSLEAPPTDDESARALVGNLSKLKGKSTTIDQAAVKTNDLVQAICDRYSTRKWFDIKGDYGGGGMFSMPSMPGFPGLGG